MSTSYFFFFFSKSLIWTGYREKKYTHNLSTDAGVTEDLKDHVNDVMIDPFRIEKDWANTEYTNLRNSTFQKRFVKANRGSHKMNPRSQKILKRFISYAMNDDSFCSLSLLHWNLKKRLISWITGGYLRYVNLFLFHTWEFHPLTIKKSNDSDTNYILADHWVLRCFLSDDSFFEDASSTTENYSFFFSVETCQVQCIYPTRILSDSYVITSDRRVPMTSLSDIPVQMKKWQIFLHVLWSMKQSLWRSHRKW